MDRRDQTLQNREQMLEERENNIINKQRDLEHEQEKVEEIKKEQIQLLEKIAGYSKEDLKTKFSSLYTAFKYGAPPHAGMAPGIDRIIMLLKDEANIREVIAFPLNKSAYCPMTNAPSTITNEQLRDVHIKIDIRDK